MRQLTLIASCLVAVGCASKKEHDMVRFIVDLEDVDNVTVAVAGKPIELAVDKADPTRRHGLVDYKVGELPEATRPEVTVQTPCGPKQVALTDRMLKGPNESNVYHLTLHEYDLPKSTKVVFAPGLQGPVKLGDFAVPTPIPARLTIYEPQCGKPIVTAEASAPIPDARALVIASSGMCLRQGVALYGTGGGCAPESSQRLGGQIVYGLPELPYVIFKGLDMSVQSSGKCTNVSYLQRC